MSEEIKNTENDVDYTTIKEAYLDVYYYQLKQANGLLGEFSHDGQYRLENEQLLKALLALPKQFQEKENDVVRAATKLGKNVLNFKVDLDLAESYCSARLFFYEIEHSVDGEDIKHETELDYIVDIYSLHFVADVYKKWNIHTTPAEIEKDNPIFKYLASQERDFAFAQELSELLSQVYLIRLLKVLENCGPEGQKILDEYNKFLKAYGKVPGSPDYYTVLKKKLDSLIIKNKAVDLVLASGGDVAMKGFANPINSIRGIETPTKVTESVTIPTTVEDKKKEEPAKVPAKKKGSGGKPKTGGKDKGQDDKGKGKDKGKDDKGKGSGGGGPEKKPEKKELPKQHKIQESNKNELEINYDIMEAGLAEFKKSEQTAEVAQQALTSRQAVDAMNKGLESATNTKNQEMEK